MALPTIAVPEFNTVLPLSKNKVLYRPFLVKEEKILLMALEGGDSEEITRAVMNVLQSCIITPINIMNLPMADIEYMFLKIRGKSVGEVMKMRAKHRDGDCKASTEIEINTDSVKLNSEPLNNIIQLTPTIGIKVKYPSFGSILKSEEDSKKSKTERSFDLLASCIESVFDDDTVYNDFTKEEIDSWLLSLNKEQHEKIKDYFAAIPKLVLDVSWKCVKCGKVENHTLEGLQSFFMLR